MNIIQSILIKNNQIKIDVDLPINITSKVTVDLSKIASLNPNKFDIEITFTSKIISFKNHDFSWVDISQDRIANSFSPKIIKLENGIYIQANCNDGIWEVNAKYPYVLLWKFNPE